jgi:Rod binding domain-containing protein
MKISTEMTAQAAAVTNAAMDAAKKAKLAQAAQQFEGMLLQEMLKPMRSGQDSWGGDGASGSGSDSSDSSNSSMDTISSFGTEAVATAIAKGGGFGIAKQVIRQVTLEHQRDAEKATTRY